MDSCFAGRKPLSWQQKIRQVNNPDSVDIAGGQFVQGHYVFGVVIPDFQEIGDLPVRFLRQVAAYLDVNAFVLPHCHKVDLSGPILADIDLISSSAQFEINDILDRKSVV